jgi:hypothetical protein
MAKSEACASPQNKRTRATLGCAAERRLFVMAESHDPQRWMAEMRSKVQVAGGRGPRWRAWLQRLKPVWEGERSADLKVRPSGGAAARHDEVAAATASRGIAVASHRTPIKA